MFPTSGNRKSHLLRIVKPVETLLGQPNRAAIAAPVVGKHLDFGIRERLLPRIPVRVEVFGGNNPSVVGIVYLSPDSIEDHVLGWKE